MFNRAISSMSAHVRWIQSSAHNIANIDTENFKAGRTVIEIGPEAVVEPTAQSTDLAREMGEQIVLSNGFEVQTRVFRDALKI